MSEKNSIDEEKFERLIAWLNPDREVAGEKYEEIRLGLMVMFQNRGCSTPEELADETIDRVANKLTNLVDTYIGSPNAYFFAVGKKVLQEYYKAPRHEELDPQLAEKEKDFTDVTPIYGCLHSCMNGLTEEERRLILGYYQKEKKAKIDNRKTLAEENGGSNELLRTRMYRLRKRLQKCISKCTGNK